MTLSFKADVEVQDHNGFGKSVRAKTPFGLAWRTWRAAKHGKRMPARHPHHRGAAGAPAPQSLQGLPPRLQGLRFIHLRPHGWHHRRPFPRLPPRNEVHLMSKPGNVEVRT